MKELSTIAETLPLIASGDTPRVSTTNNEIRELEQKIQAQVESISLEQSSAAKPIWSAKNAMTVSSMILLYSLIVLALATYLIRLGKSSASVLRIFGTVLIISSSIFLIVAGYSNQQIAPAMGLLGTVAGYLLGTDKEPKKPGTD
ncbi:hypothetical protein [Synechococcus sp. MIT S9507]|uniref:hypothetical protein n=1 Tax=Synechococcus sp. MIT S9507 TaxID=3082544 RepID=UPI0039B63E63